MIGFTYTELNPCSFTIGAVELGECPASAFDEKGRLLDELEAEYAPPGWESDYQRGGGIFRTFAHAKRAMLENAIEEVNDWRSVVAHIRKMRKPK